MKRREFLIKGGSVLLILPAGWAVTSCDDTSSNNTSNTTGTGGAGTPSSGATGGTQPTAGTGGATPTAGTGGATPTGGTGGATGSNRLTFTSSVVGAHTHQFEFDASVLQMPPSAGLSGDTSSSQGHVHTVELSAGELGQIAGGSTVAKDTSLVNGHLHTFQFHR